MKFHGNLLKALVLMLFAFATIAATAGESATGVDPLTVLPEGTTLVTRLDVKGVLSCDLLANAVKKFKDGFETKKEYVQLREATGFDLFRDLHSITLAATEESEKDNFRGVIFAKGDYNTAAIIETFTAIAEDEGKEFYTREHEGVTIYSGEDKKNAGAAFLDEHTLIIGDVKSLKSTISIFKGRDQLRISGVLSDNLALIDKKATAWVSFAMPEKAARKLQNSRDIKKRVFGEVVAVNLSLDLATGVDFGGKVTFRNAEEAAAVVEFKTVKIDVLRAVVKHMDPVLADIADTIKVEAVGSDVVFSMYASTDQVKRTVEVLKTIKKKKGTNLFGIGRFLKAMKK